MITISTGVPIDFEPYSISDWALARDDYQWFASRFIPIADKEESEPHPLIFNASQRYLKHYVDTYRNEYGGGNFLIYKGRQFGVSTWVDSLFSHQALKGPGFRAMVFAHETSAADNLLSIIRRPYWTMGKGFKLGDGQVVAFQPDTHRSNRKELWVYFDGDKTRESRVIIEEATAGEEAGASFALNGLHFSEVGKKQFDDGKAIGIAMQTLSRDAIVFAEGTANGAYGWMYNTWQEYYDEFIQFRKAHKRKPSLKWNNWVPVFLPWFWHYGYPGGLRFPLRENEQIVPENAWEESAMLGENTYLNYKCTPENIKAMRYLMGNRIKAAASDSGMSAEDYRAQEYPTNPEEGFIVSGATYFKRQVVSAGLTFAREFMRKATVRRFKWMAGGFDEDRNGEFYFIKTPTPDKCKYVLGGDVAEGLEHGDWDVTMVIEIRADGPNWVIGYWRAHEDEKYMHAVLTKHLAEWCKASKVAIENNIHGYAVNERLKEIGCPALYIQTPQDEGSFQAGHKNRYGWATGVKTRGIMLGQLHEVISKWYADPSDPDGLVIPFPEIWNEIQSFVKVKGRAQGARGSCDDMVMALAIGNSVALDTVPKKSVSKQDPFTTRIRQMRRMGLHKSAEFLKGLRKLNNA